MSNTSPTSQSPYSRPSTSYQTSSPSSAHGSVTGASTTTTTDTSTQRRNRSDSMKTIAKYPYLSECAAQRPAVYQSPYAPGPALGITEAWHPSPSVLSPLVKSSAGVVTGILRPRSGSLAQDFFKKQSASQRERVQGHVRTISTEKAILQQQEAERRRHEHQERRRRRSSKLAAMSPTFMHNSPLVDAFSMTSFSNGSGFDFGSSYNYPSMLQQDLEFGSGLQYPLPNDFQIQRDPEIQNTKPALMTHEKNSYRALVRDLQSGAGNNHGLSMDFVHNGDPTSPLRKGMRQAGTEMLPMMQDPNHPF